MSYLLDTCVLSELRKKIPESVKKWFDDKDQHLLTILDISALEHFPNFFDFLVFFI
jgi:predicted nucleic acid-binding protein